MQNGWIKLHRKSLDSTVFKNPVVWFVWCWCLMKATHEDYKFPFNGDDMTIKSGQFITGILKATGELKISPQKYRTTIEYLQKTERITVKSTNKFTLISVNKWAKYQDSNKPVTNQQQTNNNIQEHKEHKEYIGVKKIKNGETFKLECGLRVLKNYNVFYAAETNILINEKDYPELKLYA